MAYFYAKNSNKLENIIEDLVKINENEVEHLDKLGESDKESDNEKYQELEGLCQRLDEMIENLKELHQEVR